jgi:hypothetical protein
LQAKTDATSKQRLFAALSSLILLSTAAPGQQAEYDLLLRGDT